MSPTFCEYWMVVGWLGGWAAGWLGGCAVGWLGGRVCFCVAQFHFLHCRFSFSALQSFCFPCTTQSRRWQHIVLRFLDGWILPGQLVVRRPSFAATCNPPKMPAEIKAPNPPLAHPPSVLRRTLTQFIYNAQTTHFT